MSNPKYLQIYYDGKKRIADNAITMSAEEYVSATKQFFFLKNFKRFKTVDIYCRSFHRIGKTFLVLFTAKMLSSKQTTLIDENGNRRKVTAMGLMGEFSRFLQDKISADKYIQRCSKHIEALEKKHHEPHISAEGSPYYLRCDYTGSFIAGGSIGHIAGIANNIRNLYGKIQFITSDYIPTVNDEIEQVLVEDNDDLRYSNISDITSLYYNKHVLNTIDSVGKREKAKFVYQRSALNQYSGVEYSLNNNVPLVLEYNGSEAWIRANWSGKKKFLGTDLSVKIERLSFSKASLIVCVSKPLQDELISWGVDPSKIIVVPNGVDVDTYRPDIDGSGIRDNLGIDRKSIVVGFIGTYGAWHGSEILAQAAVEIMAEKKNVDFLFIGDGKMMPKVKEIIDSSSEKRRCHFTGIVPQQEGKNYLAACDILVSPQIPNPDGTPFFGSPTKLFEYMAMGKAIVVSDMDQMAEICSNGEDALLSIPGDYKDVKSKITLLCDDEALRRKLGQNARNKVCEKYTWQNATETIIKELEIRCK